MKHKNRSTHDPGNTSDSNLIVIDGAKRPSSCHRMPYDRQEAARQLSVSIRALDYYIGAKKILTRRVGRKVLIPHSELVRFASMNHYGPIASGF